MRPVFLPGIVILFLLTAAMPSKAAKLKRLLVVTTTTGFRHSSIPTAEKVLGQLAEQSHAFTVDYLRQPEGPQSDEAMKKALEALSPQALAKYDGVVFASTTGDLPIPDKPGFLAWIKSGKAFIGIHSASDTFHGWPGYIDMLGGEFDHHGPQVAVDCLNVDPRDRATKHLGADWKIDQEEIYQFKNYDPKRVHELLVLDKSPSDGTPGHYPIAWHRSYGKGRVFYTALGHREDIWDADPLLADRKNSVETSRAFQAHLLGGILWALGVKR